MDPPTLVASLQEAVPGTYGPILNTFVHLVGADQRYLEGLTGEPAESPLRQGDLPPLTDLRQRFEAQTRRWEAEGRVAPQGSGANFVDTFVIGSRYFETLGIPLLHGRDFGNESEQSQRVAIVNEALAERFWPGEDAVGKRLQMGKFAPDARGFEMGEGAHAEVSVGGPARNPARGGATEACGLAPDGPNGTSDLARRAAS